MPPHDPVRRLRAEALAPREFLRLRRSRIYAGDGVAHGDELPVLLIPAFLVDDASLSVMAHWLRRTGYRPRRSRLGRNVGCAERSLGRLERRLVHVSNQEGRRVVLVGHSRGGHFARVLAVRHPDRVAGIITLGAPPMDPRAVHAAVAAPAIALTLLGSAGVPGLMRSSCFVGRCCERFRRELDGPFPQQVPYVAVYSKSDAIVDWHRLSDRHAERVDVHASHIGLAVNKHAYAAVAAALQRFREEGDA